MTRGTVTKAWARLHHPRWYREVTGEETPPRLDVAVEAAFERRAARAEALAGEARDGGGAPPLRGRPVPRPGASCRRLESAHAGRPLSGRLEADLDRFQRRPGGSAAVRRGERARRPWPRRRGLAAGTKPPWRGRGCSPSGAATASRATRTTSRGRCCAPTSRSCEVSGSPPIASTGRGSARSAAARPGSPPGGRNRTPTAPGACSDAPCAARSGRSAGSAARAASRRIRRSSRPFGARPIPRCGSRPARPAAATSSRSTSPWTRGAIPEVDDLVSLAMDLWAQEQGFARLEPGLAGI